MSEHNLTCPKQGVDTSYLCSCLPGGLGLSLDDSLSDQSELRLKFLSIVHGVIDKGESCALSTAKIGFNAKYKDSVGCGLVHGAQLLTDGGLGWTGLARMKDINNHLSSSKKTIGEEFSRSNGHATFNNHFVSIKPCLV